MLQEAGYNTCQSIAMATKRDLLTVKRLGETKVDRLLAEGMFLSLYNNIFLLLFIF